MDTAGKFRKDHLVLLLRDAHPPLGIERHRQLRYRRRRALTTSGSYHSSQNYDICQNQTSGASPDGYGKVSNSTAGMENPIAPGMCRTRHRPRNVLGNYQE